jgi:hypothetical protein
MAAQGVLHAHGRKVMMLGRGTDHYILPVRRQMWGGPATPKRRKQFSQQKWRGKTEGSMRPTADNLRLLGWTQLHSGVWISPGGQRYHDFQSAWKAAMALAGRASKK